MQDNHLQSLLTVGESMNFAMKLKTGNKLSTYEKWEKITKVLKAFGLADIKDTYVKNISGGQQKRLAIALEIVDDPMIIFLDEPTTGLDSVSSTMCLNLLNDLVQEGKTIICTIHQPSGNQLLLFDHLYAISNGECIYQGSPNNLVSFLSECNLQCPSHYNPADFLLEVATGIYGEKTQILIDKIENGMNEIYRSASESVNRDDRLELAYSPSNASQFSNLLLRNFITSFRDSKFIILRVFMHIAVGLLLGTLYYDIGRDAEHILDNFRLLFVAMSFITYTAYYSLMVVFPINFPWIKRETFNRWYSPTKWFIAMLICDIPIVVITNFLFVLPIYYLTSQPFELFRFNAFAIILILTSFTSQAFGLIAGSFVGLKGTLILAPILMIFHGAFSGFYILKKDSHPFWHPFFELSYIRYSAYGTELSILGFNRTKLDCESFYCHFRSPQKFLQSVGFEENYMTCVWMLILNFCLNIIIAYFLIRHQIKHKTYSK
ncbi:hypothetical protein ACKWTF_001999 [Chironomus riparius]